MGKRVVISSLNLPDDVKADIDLAVCFLLDKFGADVLRVILFGSFAKDTYQPDSDIDLAVVLNNPPDARSLHQYKQSFELDHREIDLLFCSIEQLESNKFVFRWINEQGVVLYEKL